MARVKHGHYFHFKIHLLFKSRTAKTDQGAFFDVKTHWKTLSVIPVNIF